MLPVFPLRCFILLFLSFLHTSFLPSALYFASSILPSSVPYSFILSHPFLLFLSFTDSITIPRCDYPVLHMALRGAIVSVSGIREAERDEMYRKIQLMYGCVAKSLTLEVTHLVTMTTGASSKKYIVAAEKGIPILSPKWLQHCWEAGKNEQIDGSAADVVAKFRCPLFEGMKFCASGYNLKERNFIKETAIAEGATYSGEMHLQNCSHLIVKEPTCESVGISHC